MCSGSGVCVQVPARVFRFRGVCSGYGSVQVEPAVWRDFHSSFSDGGVWVGGAQKRGLIWSFFSGTQNRKKAPPFIAVSSPGKDHTHRQDTQLPRSSGHGRHGEFAVLRYCTEHPVPCDSTVLGHGINSLGTALECGPACAACEACICS